jgi:hypothetical protein
VVGDVFELEVDVQQVLLPALYVVLSELPKRCCSGVFFMAVQPLGGGLVGVVVDGPLLFRVALGLALLERQVRLHPFDAPQFRQELLDGEPKILVFSPGAVACLECSDAVVYVSAVRVDMRLAGRDAESHEQCCDFPSLGGLMWSMYCSSSE